MTTAQLASANKATLLEYVATLQTAEAEAKAQTQNAINIANYFAQVIEAIEKLLLNSPFVNQEGKFFKKLYWVLSNFSTIKTVIENIIAQIKEWRKQVNALTAAQVPAQDTTNVA